MSDDPIREHETNFAEHDLFLHALLGALHHVVEIENRIARARSSTDEITVRGSVDEPMALVLGCAALGRDLRDRVLASCPPAEPLPESPRAAWDRSLWK